MIPPNRMPALDGLRGVAILMVLFVHGSFGWTGVIAFRQNTSGWPGGLILPEWLQRVADGGSHGVQLFFVVSAFTLTTGWRGLEGYALRRIARIAPGYWLAGVGYTLLEDFGPRFGAPNGIETTDLITATLFGSAWTGGPSLAIVPGGWSVACEASFYVALPMLIWGIDGRIWRAVLLTCLSSIIAQALYRHSMVSVVHPLEQAPVFFCGVTAALIAMRVSLPRAPWIVMGLLISAIVLLPLRLISWPPAWYLQSHLVFACLAAVAIALAATHPPRLLSSLAMRKIGEVSYSMYLLHFAVIPPSLYIAGLLSPGGDWTTMLLHFAITTVATFLAACVTYRVIERPMINWAAARARPLSGFKVMAARN